MVEVLNFEMISYSLGLNSFRSLDLHNYTLALRKKCFIYSFFVAIRIAGFEAKDSIVDFKVLISTESVEGLSLSFFWSPEFFRRDL